MIKSRYTRDYPFEAYLIAREKKRDGERVRIFFSRMSVFHVEIKIVLLPFTINKRTSTTRLPFF